MLINPDDLASLEMGLWRATGNRDAYAAHLAPDALHVLPGLGVVGREPALDAVACATPWDEVAIDELEVLPGGDDGAAVVYQVRASRGGTEYAAAVTSIYRRIDGQWRIVLHQQTPVAADG